MHSEFVQTFQRNPAQLYPTHQKVVFVHFFDVSQLLFLRRPKVLRHDGLFIHQFQSRMFPKQTKADGKMAKNVADKKIILEKRSTRIAFSLLIQLPKFDS